MRLYYLGFGTCFELEELFFFAALAFACFCAACLCVAFGDLSPMTRRLRSSTNGVNTDPEVFSITMKILHSLGRNSADLEAIGRILSLRLTPLPVPIGVHVTLDCQKNSVSSVQSVVKASSLLNRSNRLP